ncbi:hypothetical protein WUBG_19029, partial [Wuchereria bancrofti]
ILIFSSKLQVLNYNLIVGSTSNQFISTESSKLNPPVADASQGDLPGTAPTGQLPPVDKSVDLDGDGALSLAEVQYAAF